MKEKNENRLDQLFKDGLSGSEDHFAFREEDWESMEQLLDEKPGKKAGLFRIIYYASGIAALLLLAAGLYFYTKTDKTDPLITKNAGKATKTQAQSDSGQAVIQQGEKPAVPVENLAANSQKKISVPQVVSPNGVSNPLNPTLVRVQHGRKILNDTIYADPQKIAGGHGLRRSTPKRDTIYNNPVNNIAATPMQKVKTPDKDTIYNATGNLALNQGKKNKVAGADTIYNNNLAAAQNQKGNTTVNRDTIYDKIKAREEQQRIAVKRDAIKYRPQFSISVLAASDANGVNSFGRSQTGSNYGFQFSVRLTKKLTVSTGAAYAIKPYATNIGSYNSPSYNPTVLPTNIQANCKVLDIPLNVSYQLYSNGSNAIALGTGLSSYFMLKEDYRFDYSAESGWKPYNLEVKNKNTHLFGVVNIDVNYQRRINSKFSAVIQPYMKLPITGIGNGNVNLKSTGVALGVNWNLGRR